MKFPAPQFIANLVVEKGTNTDFQKLDDVVFGICRTQFPNPSDEEIFDVFSGGLSRVFPHFRSEDVSNYHVFRAPFAAPVFTLGYSAQIPENETPVPGFYWANIAHVYPEDRNVNNSIVLARKISGMIQNRDN